jgi:septum formation protein
MNNIILASGSPRRKQLLEWAELQFTVVVSDAAEDYPTDLPIPRVPVHIARNKAAAVFAGLDAESQDRSVIIAADTVVVLEDKIIGKPVDSEDAISILGNLSGRWHQVITGVVIRQGEREETFDDRTEVEFHQLSVEDINYYVSRYQPFDKAGAYAIQEWIGVTGIRRINGDFYNVMGLPVSRVLKTLKDFR